MMYSMVTTMNNTALHSFSAFLFIYLFKIYFRCIGSSLRYVSLSCCGAQVTERASSVFATQGPSCPMAHGILYSSTRDQTCIRCVGRWILNHWTTRKSPDLNLQKAIISYFQEDDWSFCYDDCQRHLQELIWLKFHLRSWNKLDLVFACMLRWFCLLREFLSPVSILILTFL